MLEQVLLNGLVAGSIYVLMALGFSLIFGILHVPNFAHGHFYMWGAYLTYVLQARMGLNYFPALLLGALVVGLAGVICEFIVFRPLHDREFTAFIVSMGLSAVLENSSLLIFGGEEKRVIGPVHGAWQLGNLSIPLDRFFVLVAAVLLLLIFNRYINRSKHGKALRAVKEDGEIAAIQGVWIGGMRSLAFFIATLLAALAGGLLAPVFAMSPSMGHFPMSKAFVVVILGGLGSIPGAVVGGLLVGLLDSYTGFYLGSAVGTQLTYLLVAIALVIRPQGLFGKMVVDR